MSLLPKRCEVLLVDSEHDAESDEDRAMLADAMQVFTFFTEWICQMCEDEHRRASDADPANAVRCELARAKTANASSRASSHPR